MTDETVECFNCGSTNPEWAQVCRSCGVVLRHGETRISPAERIPTDRDSVVSIAAVIGTILAALVIGLFVSSLNPTDPTVGLASPSPTATPEPSPSESATPVATDTPVASATPAPLPGTVAFGTALDGSGNVTDPTDTFAPGAQFAYAVSMPNGFGGTPLENELVKVAEDGTETVVLEREPVSIDPAATVFGYVIGTADGFLNPLGGAGSYVWRAYVGDQLIAEGSFTYTG
jgi:hypothetical protein